jgi:hypothetical protein
MPDKLPRIKASDLSPDVLAKIEAANPPAEKTPRAPDLPIATPPSPRPPRLPPSKPASKNSKRLEPQLMRLQYPISGRTRRASRRSRITAGRLLNPGDSVGVPQAADEWGASVFLMAVAGIVLYLLLSDHIKAVGQVFTGVPKGTAKTTVKAKK